MNLFLFNFKLSGGGGLKYIESPVTYHVDKKVPVFLQIWNLVHLDLQK